MPTLIAFILAGVALVLTQVPYGRFGTIGVAFVGLMVAAACWFGAQRPLLPAVATGLNLVIVALAFLFPSWLGIDSWRPVPKSPDAGKVMSFGARGPASSDRRMDASLISNGSSTTSACASLQFQLGRSS